MRCIQSLALGAGARHVQDMLNILSILFGIIALPFTLIGVVPLLGSVNYLAIVFAIIGLVLGVLSSHKAGRNLNIIVLIVSIIRLWVGGFVF